MELLDRVRELGAESQPSEQSIVAARARLAQAIADAPARARRRAWGLGLGGGAGALMAAAAATAVVVMVSGGPAVAPSLAPTTAPQPEPQPQHTPTPAPRVTIEPAPVLTAAAVLDRAASLAAASVTPLTDGQWLRVQHHVEQLVTYAEGVDPNSPYNATRETATAAWVARGSYATYVPADPSGEWFRVFEPDRQIVALYGADAEALANQWLDIALDERIVERYEGGLDFAGDGREPIYASEAYFEAMPRDPAALVAWHRARMEAGNVENLDEGVVSMLVQDLELNAAPADLRSAMFHALALAEGVTIRSVDGAITTLEFPFTGSGRTSRATVSIDTLTGHVVESAVSSSLVGPLVPADVPDNRVTTTVSVVDSAP
jgi:hypothetical protein